jgi:threonine/homoserine/homoserine lactone efflux protein
MDYILPLIIGFLAAFIGLLAPSMLNMTAARTSIEKGKNAGIIFAAGAASVVFIQAYLAVTFAKYLIANPNIITRLKTTAIFVLFALSIFFFIKAKKTFNASGKQKEGNSYIIGFGMSSLNMLAIPFYLAMATLAENNKWMTIKWPFSFFYVLGTVLGAFSLFAIYAIFAEIIANKVKFIAKNINYILSGLFIILALITAFQVVT